jgi:hypothetical protein
VEVIVAIGMVAVSVVALIALLAAGSRSAGDIATRNRAVHLADAVTLELARLRDTLPRGSSASGLAALAETIPPSASSQSLRLVAPLDGLRAIQESDADNPDMGVRPHERFFLIEVRQQSGDLANSPDAGFLAVAATVRWPYQPGPGPGARAVSPADLSQAATAVLNLAITP